MLSCRLQLLVCIVILSIVYAAKSDDDQYPCMGRGYRSETSGNCNCINGYFGYKCQYKYCPFGTSWHSKPLVEHARNTENVACSNAGDCDHDTGECICRPGYDGRACERMACPTRPMLRFAEGVDNFYNNRYTDPNDLTTLPVTIGVGGDLLTTLPFGSSSGNTIIMKAGTIPGLDPPCSGHGRCRTMRDASEMWDGLNLIHPPAFYTSWEADKMQGCLCDKGWDGFDCSLRSCPWGRDPLDSQLSTYKNEIYTIECQATVGYFAIDIHGGHTAPIPYDADYMYLKKVLEGVDGVGTVDVTMQENRYGNAQICGDGEKLKTQFTLRDHAGLRPPARINKKLGNSRFRTDSSTLLKDGENDAIIRFVSEYTMNCKDVNEHGHGYIQFAYGDSITENLDITSNGASAAVAGALIQLGDLVNAGWTNLDVETSILGRDGNDKICYGQNNTMIIEIQSDYGNIPGLKLIDGSYAEQEAYVTLGFGGRSLGITLTSNSGTGPVYECSNQGTCDRLTGTCKCLAIENFEGDDRHVTMAKAAASDPSSLGGAGYIGDCGHMEHNTSTCLLSDDNNASTACNGQGVCKNGRCECYDGFGGMDCSIQHCPKAAAWFDEPTSSTKAHEAVECAGFGFCDRKEGKCICRDGFTGNACQIKDCPSDPNTGEYCNGHGYCHSVHDIFSLYGLSYGSDLRPSLNEPQTWDANMIYECLCSAKYSAGEFGHPLKTPNDPKDWVGRYHVGGRPVPGWTGYACHQRLCPRGDSQTTENSLRVTPVVKERQRVLCTLTSGTFYMKFFGQKTPLIDYDATDLVVKRAIESINTVGNVTVIIEDGSQACKSDFTSGTGMTVQFDTEGGDLPLTVVGSDTDANEIGIEADVDGTSENLECGGVGVGMCDRENGVCDCAPDRYSSDGEGGMGANGDCGHRPNRAGFSNDFSPSGT